MQCEIEGKKLYPGLRIEKNLYDDRVVSMPISAFLANDEDENYTRVKKALIALRSKTFEFDDGRVWKLIGIIENHNSTTKEDGLSLKYSRKYIMPFLTSQKASGSMNLKRPWSLQVSTQCVSMNS